METPSYDRLSEIASLAIDGLLQDDEEQALIYLNETLELDVDECNYFGIDIAKMREVNGGTLKSMSLFDDEPDLEILKHLVNWEDGYPAITSIPYVFICSNLPMEKAWTCKKTIDNGTYEITVFRNGLVQFGVVLRDGSWRSSNSEQINKVFADELKDRCGDDLMPQLVSFRDVKDGDRAGGRVYGIINHVFKTIEEKLKESPYKEMEQPSRYKRK